MSDQSPSPAELAFRELRKNPRAYRAWADEVNRLWQADRAAHPKETSP